MKPLDEGDRQMVLLALANLALLRPGFDFAIGLIAEKLDGKEMCEEFKRLNSDVVKPVNLWPQGWGNPPEGA
jgi:hypothetical protein